MVRLLDFTEGVHQIQQAAFRGGGLRGDFPLPRRRPRRLHPGGVGESARFSNVGAEPGAGPQRPRKAEEDRFLQWHKNKVGMSLA